MTLIPDVRAVLADGTARRRYEKDAADSESVKRENFLKIGHSTFFTSCTNELAFLGQRPLMPLFLLSPLFFLIILFVSTTLLTLMTSIPLHMQWPLTSQWHDSGSQREQLSFLLRIKLHAKQTS
jgi:hypothetical protein